MKRDENSLQAVLSAIVRGNRPKPEYREDKIFKKYGEYIGGDRNEWRWAFWVFKSDPPIEDLLYMIKCMTSEDVYNFALRISKL